MEYSNLINLIKNNFVPVVLLLSTPEVEQICKKNETSLLRLLNKFTFSPQPTRIRTLGEQSYEVRGFQVRFVTLPDLLTRCLPQEQQEKSDSSVSQYLYQVASYHATDKLYTDLPVTDTEYVKSLQGKDSTPWFNFYRWEYLRSLGVSDFEYFEHPVSILFAVSSDNPDNVNEEIRSLWDDKNLPAPFKSGQLDPNIPKHYLVVHDCQSDTDSEKKVNTLRTLYEKTRVSQIKINSLQEKSEQGNFLSQVDWQQLENYMKELIFRGVIPHLERSVLSLNDFVEQSKKGIGSSVARLFGLGGRKKEPAKEEVSVYAISSVESSHKRLGDYLFMLNDYGEALNVYKSASKNYNNDKCGKYYAASNELAALSLFMLEPAKKELETYLENAYSFYLKENLHRFSVRVTFFSADILKVRRNLLGAAAKLLRAAERENDKLCSGMLYEQSGFCHLNLNPPQLRKYAFRLVMGGHTFSLINQHKHSMRCYRTAYTVYDSLNWMLVDDYLHFSLARNSFILGNMDMAMVFIQRLLQKNYQSPQKQSTYLREFLHIFDKASEEKGVRCPILPIPVINNESVVVMLRDYPTKSPLQDLWRQMEKSLKNEGKRKPVKFRLANKERKKPVPKLAVIGEPIIIELDIHNPLQIPIQFTKVNLLGNHTPPPPSSSSSDNTSIDSNSAPFTSNPFDLILGPKETQKLKFSVLPEKVGTLSIQGIGFRVSDAVEGKVEFKLPQRRLNDTSEQRKGKFYEPNLDLTFKIIGKMPLLDVDVLDFPNVLYHGQYVPIQFILKNSGSSRLKNIKVKLSNPSFFSFEQGEELSTPQLIPANSSSRIASKYSADVIGAESFSIYHIDGEGLNVGETITVPCWIRAHKVGIFQFNFLFYYESEDVNENSEMKYRLFRISNTVKVIPSIKCTTASNFSYSNINAYLLDLEIANVQDDLSVHFQRISSFSSNWKIDPLSFVPPPSNSQDDSILLDSGDQFVVKGKQSNTLFFRMSPLNESNKESNSDSNNTNNNNADVIVSKALVFPTLASKKLSTSSCPFNDFLQREKAFLADKKRQIKDKDNKEEESNSIMDFVLLWEALDKEGKSIMGQINICNISFLTPNTAEHSVAENNPLRFSVQSPRKVLHDFNNQTICMVPVVFHISNRSNSTPLSFYLDTLRPHESLENTASSTTHRNSLLQKRSQYFWSGNTLHYVADLQPEQKIEIETFVCFSRPGIYNLNRYKFSIKDSKKNSVLQQIFSPYQHLIMIEDQNENSLAEDVISNNSSLDKSLM